MDRTSLNLFRPAQGGLYQKDFHVLRMSVRVLCAPPSFRIEVGRVMNQALHCGVQSSSCSKYRHKSGIFETGMRNSYKAMFTLLPVLLGATARGVDVNGSSAKVDYDRDIRPIFSDTCFKCHGPDANKRKAKLRLDIDTGAYEDHDGQAAVTPGDLAKSEAWRRINAAGTDDLMPPGDSGMKLTPQQIKLLGDWIRQGAKYTPHWSFVPPVAGTVPKVKHAGGPQNAIDNFILTKLESEQMVPSAEADKIT